MSRCIAAVALLALLTGCAKHYSPEAVADPYGFFSGLWHGFVCPYASVTNLLSGTIGLFGQDVFSSIEIVGHPNSGFGYWVGFLMGLMPYGGANTR